MCLILIEKESRNVEMMDGDVEDLYVNKGEGEVCVRAGLRVLENEGAVFQS